MPRSSRRAPPRRHASIGSGRPLVTFAPPRPGRLLDDRRAAVVLADGGGDPRTGADAVDLRNSRDPLGDRPRRHAAAAGGPADPAARTHHPAPRTASVPQLRSPRLAVLLGQERPAASARDRLRARIHRAGLDAAARGAAARRANDAQPHRRGRARAGRHPGHPAAGHRDVPAGGAAGADGGVRLCGHDDHDQAAHDDGHHVRDHLLDERHPVSAGDARRPTRCSSPRSRSIRSRPAVARRRHRRAVALLPDQRVPRRRRQRGGAARFHAHSADRRDRLVALQRIDRRLRVRRARA